MNKKKITILACTLFMVMSLGACGKAKEDEFTVTQQESESVDSEINNDENTESEDSQCNLLEYLTQRDIQTKNSGVNVRYRGKHRFFKGFNEFIKEKTRRCDNDFEKIECHVFF